MQGEAMVQAVQVRERGIPYVGMYTPRWGKAQSVRLRVPGVWEISTAGHGGFKVATKLNNTIPAIFRRKGGWYEEDCEAYIVLHFLVKSDPNGEYLKGLKSNYPDEYEKYTGHKVTAEESHIVRMREAKEAAKGKLQSYAAWGD